MSALLFGSISTLADTSELQREAFNEAFADHGLTWNWGQDEYRSQLASSGGSARIAAYARERGEEVDADAVHETKSKLFQSKLASAPVSPRAGVPETIEAARAAGLKLGFVTTTSADNVTALLSALEPDVNRADFSIVLSLHDVDAAKPDPAVYLKALELLDEDADHCVAVEDNPGGAESAAAAGIDCIAFPNENTANLDFSTAQATVGRLDIAAVQERLG